MSGGGYGTTTNAGSAKSRLSALSEGQREALALVAQYKSSKEIARILNISPHTVDQRMKRVQALLGVASRFEAARVFMECPADAAALPSEAWGGLIYPTSDVPAIPLAGEAESSATESDPAVDGVTFHQAPPAYADGFIGWNSHRPWYGVLFRAGQENEFSLGQRAGIIGGMAMMAILTMALMVSVVEGLSRIF